MQYLVVVIDHAVKDVFVTLHTCDPNAWENNLKEELFILAHSFRGFSPWSLGSMHLGRTSWQQEFPHLMANRMQHKEGAKDQV
jgi:hypothetical protein